MTLDFDATTTELRRVYPALEHIETMPAWPLPAPHLPIALRAGQR